jgi:UDP-2-acetamido-3-amino-2,3-dideoxy-glucuronate N-acetyltransferase
MSEMREQPGGYFVHTSSFVDDADPGRNLAAPVIGEGTRIWHFSHVCPGAVIGKNVMIGQGCYIGPGVVIEDGVKIQNGNSLYEGITVKRNAFVGPHCTFTNDRNPVAADHREKGEWLEQTVLEEDSSLGAGTVIRCGITVGKGARTGAGSLVTKDIPAGELWVSQALPASKMPDK